MHSSAHCVLTAANPRTVQRRNPIRCFTTTTSTMDFLFFSRALSLSFFPVFCVVLRHGDTEPPRSFLTWDHGAQMPYGTFPAIMAAVDSHHIPSPAPPVPLEPQFSAMRHTWSIIGEVGTVIVFPFLDRINSIRPSVVPGRRSIHHQPRRDRWVWLNAVLYFVEHRGKGGGIPLVC